MFKFLRVPERVFAITMWLVSLAFAGFLVGLGGKIVADLPQLEKPLSVEQFAAQPALSQAREAIKTLDAQRVELDDQLARARLETQAATNAKDSARSAYANWLAARTATTDAAQDPEVLERTRALDELQARQRQTQAATETLQAQALANSQALRTQRETQAELLRAATADYEQARFMQELRVFGVRPGVDAAAAGGGRLVAGAPAPQRLLAADARLRAVCRLHLLLRTGALPAQLRRLCALRRGCAADGRGRALRHQGHAPLPGEAPAGRAADRSQRRQSLTTKTALKKMAAGVCPGCERAVLSTGDVPADFCVHCGLTLFNRCGACRPARTCSSAIAPNAARRQRGETAGDAAALHHGLSRRRSPG
jgi:hypothetical protein